MKPERAIQELVALRRDADEEVVRRSSPEHGAWKAKTVAVMTSALGADSATLAKFRDLRYSVGVWTGAPGEAARDEQYFAKRVGHAQGLIDAAIYELGLMTGDETVEGASYDVGLWQHVRHSVEEGRWEQVASASAIYVEDKVRRWSQLTDKDGRALVGQGLFAQALGEGGPLALGQQSNETIGWRNLGIGFVAALGNVDRHHIQERPDARQYALGVLGLASLLLTQLRYERSEVIAATET